ncbi:MAG TPA: hypothetical protein PL110_08110 [Candidatus Eremiobacteraeota bacterium]|nr:hypothetical protein [Candidatus Eremiobacteraeota bacterium]
MKKKKALSENINYMSESFKKRLADTNKYSKLQFKIIGTTASSTDDKRN